VAPVPEGVGTYPRWRGRTETGSRLGIIVAQEIRVLSQNLWFLAAAVLGLGVVGAGSVMELVQYRQDGLAAHSWDRYTIMLDQLRWFALAVAAVAGPGLLEDARRGALELYLSRPVSRRAYLLGKALAVVAATLAVMALPVLFYYVASLAFYDEHPEAWHARAVAGGLAFSLLWTALAAGLALGLACVARRAVTATVGLFGGFLVLHFAATRLLGDILTEDAQWQVLSPFSATGRFHAWLFGTGADAAFPLLWALLLWGALTVLGWALMAWRHPRVRGEEPVRRRM